VLASVPVTKAKLTGLVKRRILVVEDAYLIALGVCMQLEAFGCTVVGPAGRLGRALSLARHEQLDAAVLDVNLAGEFSFPVAKVLSERGIPYVIFTGYDDDGVFPSEYKNVIKICKPLPSRNLGAMLAGYFGGRKEGTNLH